MAVSSAYRASIVLVLRDWGMSFMNMLKKVGPREEPYGTPDRIFLCEYVRWITFTLKERLDRLDLIMMIRGEGKLSLNSFASRPVSQTFSKAFLESRDVC